MENNPRSAAIKSAWKHAFTFPAFREQFIAAILICLSFTVVFNLFFDFVEGRKGAFIDDDFLKILPAYNVSWIVFFFLYSGIVFGVYYHLTHPKTILVILQTYIIVSLVRICTITLIPLEPPEGYIPLREPFVQLFTSGGRIISKDLFFSGHMSTILSLYFASHRKYVKTFLLLCSFMVGVMVLVQRVHYTVDVIFAIPATYLIYRFSRKYLGGRTF